VTENKKLTQVEKVALNLRKMILNKEIAPGQRVVQDEISRTFGVSKIPVREALKILEAEGLIYSEPYKGAFVNDISINYIEETFFLRSILEGISCAQATIKFDDDSINELHQIMECTREAINNRDMVEFIKKSRGFHDYIHRLSGYTRLNLILENLKSGVLPYNIVNLKEQGQRSLNEHQYIFEKIKNKDAEGAGNAMRMHIQRAGVDAVQQLKE
jgi:DNA-binding GntR family transcriptional regulator